MKKICVSESWYRTVLIPFLDEFKAVSLKRKVCSAVLGMLEHQRTRGELGRKTLYDKYCIPVSKDDLTGLFSKWSTCKKFCHLSVEMGVVRKDGSWVSPSIAKKAGKEPYSNSWHVTEPDTECKRHVEVEYDENLSLVGACLKDIRKAEGFDFNGDRFSGAWAIDGYIAGKVDWSDLVEVRKCARMLLRGAKPKNGEPAFRTFDAFTQCRRDIRSKCFTSKRFPGEHPREVFDLHGSFSFTSVLAAASLMGGTLPFRDRDLYEWADNLRDGSPSDPYRWVWSGMLDADPHTNCVGHEWTDDVRDKVKKSVNVALNCDMAMIEKAYNAYHGFFKGERVSKQSRRLWLAFIGIKETNPALWEVMLRSKSAELHNAFYWLGVMGEKMVMDLLVTELEKAGYSVHRVHDAIWTSDPRLTGKASFDKVVGRILVDFIKRVNPGLKGHDAIDALRNRCVSREDKYFMYFKTLNLEPSVMRAGYGMSVHRLVPLK